MQSTGKRYSGRIHATSLQNYARADRIFREQSGGRNHFPDDMSQGRQGQTCRGL